MSNDGKSGGKRSSKADALSRLSAKLPKGFTTFSRSSPKSSLAPSAVLAESIDENDDAPEAFEVIRVRSHNRPDILTTQIVHRKASLKFIQSQLHLEDIVDDDTPDSTAEASLHASEASFDVNDYLDNSQKEVLLKETDYIKKVMKKISVLEPWVPLRGHQVEVRLRNVSFFVPTDAPERKQNFIRTVWNQSFCYLTIEFLHRLHKVTQHKRRQKKRVLSQAFNGDFVSENGDDAVQTPVEMEAGVDPREPSIRLFPKSYKAILCDVSVCLQPGKMYLVLGAPGSGKTTFLKAIAGLLPNYRVIAGANKGKPRRGLPYTDGKVEYNGLTMENDSGFVFTNAISFVDQLDRHAPRLTVKETFDFAFQCKSGGTHRPMGSSDSPEAKAIIKEMDKEDFLVESVMEGLGISHVADTFVGNSDVRGVSGGQRRRVTVGEMMQSGWSGTPIMCADEVSNGLDSRSTYDIIRSMSHFSKMFSRTRIISLLQPSPETFSLFDEVIVLSEGRIVYAGPIDQVVDYFEKLGYPLPARMDVADFLQTISTPDGAELFCPKDPSAEHYTAKRFAEIFRTSAFGEKIQHQLQSTHPFPWRNTPVESPDVEIGSDLSSSVHEMSDILNEFRIRFRNSFARSTWLVLKRQLTIWRRDRRFVIANFVKNLVMGLSVGMVFYQADNAVQYFGALFQGMLFIMLGAMTAAPEQISDRAIYYKHSDANFYQTFAFATGRFLALTPQAAFDVVTFGSILYWMIGLSPNVASFFIFIGILFTFQVVMNNMLGIFASVLATKAGVQAVSAFILFISVLFGGFIVSPAVIPGYYSWLYWWNPFAWAYRALVVNEFTSPSSQWSQALNVTGTSSEGAPAGTYRIGDLILYAYGFDLNGDPFGQEWIAYCFAYLVPFIALSVILTGVGLKYVRIEGRPGNIPTVEIESVSDSKDNDESDDFDVPFTPVDLSFEDISYEVKASTGGGSLKLLNNITGILKSGRMCALMGSSGAGKTTLMDVIAMRKSTGTVTGEVRLNGFLQEKNSFRRCSGYVEQFDVQTPELTVRETIAFSANLRLDPSNPSIKDEADKMRFVDGIIRMFELTPLKNSQVGTDDEGGLTFEQRKRLSIAVEFAASPSILFLDEPTTGLDSRAAMLVMNSLKRVVATGRTVCATIHQPSSAVFAMFDDLLLLKKGGAVVFHGELGNGSADLVDYFERNGADRIEYGVNPATWMLAVLDDKNKDWAETYIASEESQIAKGRVGELKEAADDSKKISYDAVYACNFGARNKLMNRRLNLIYWRSPAYNLGRVVVSVVISFILGSVFVTRRHKPVYDETEIEGMLSIIFLSFIIMGVLSIITVLPVMLSIRDVYYRHNLAGMLEHTSLALALGVAEKKYIVMVSSIFVLVFYFTVGLANSLRKFAAFWAFFTFNVAIYSYFGQAFMCLVSGMATAQILCSVFIGINNFFSGLIVRPQYLNGFWALPFWLTPGHYVYEGLVASQFYDDERTVIASPGTEFFWYLNCTVGQPDVCEGTVKQYVGVFFGGKYQFDHILYDACALGLFLIFARVLTYYALKRFNFASK